MRLRQIQPELRAVAEETSQAQGGIGRDRTLAVDDVADTRCRHLDLQRQAILRYPELLPGLFLFPVPSFTTPRQS